MARLLTLGSERLEDVAHEWPIYCRIYYDTVRPRDAQLML